MPKGGSPIGKGMQNDRRATPDLSPIELERLLLESRPPHGEVVVAVAKRAWLGRPFGRRRRLHGYDQPIKKFGYLYVWCYETPRVKRAPGARGGIAACSAKAPTFAPGSPRFKT